MEDPLVDLMKKTFQEVKRWGYELMDKPSTTPYFYNMVIRLVHSILKQQHYLTIGYQKSPLLLAWACRNLLEVDVITRYCLMSPGNGKDFSDDMWIDGIEIFKLFRDWIGVMDPGVQTPELDQTIANFEAEKEQHGLTRKKYLAVSDLAKVAGMDEEYRHMNKVTSKLVHPTAFSVLAFAEEGELQHLRPIMFNAETAMRLKRTGRSRLMSRKMGWNRELRAILFKYGLIADRVLHLSSSRSSRPTAAAAFRSVLNVTASYSGSSRRSSAARLVRILRAISALEKFFSFIAAPTCRARTRLMAVAVTSS